MVKAIFFGHDVSCVLNFGSCAQFLKYPTVHHKLIGAVLPQRKYHIFYCIVHIVVSK
jgi:hypothetical protein